MTAFVDESIRFAGRGLYVVAAVVIAEDLYAARDAARSVLVKRQPPVGPDHFDSGPVLSVDAGWRYVRAC